MQAALNLPVPPAVPALVALPVALAPEPIPSIGTAAPMLVFGLDQAGRPHATCFAGHALELVEHASDLMDLFCVAADTDALRDLGAQLPAGRLFASGRGFVPYCKASIYEQLLDATGLADAPRPLKAASRTAEAGGSGGGGQGRGAGGSGAGDPPATRVGAKAPSDHSQIGLGSYVLAQDEESFGYFPAKVVTTKTPDAFTLLWLGDYDLPEFAKPRRELALLHPEVAQAME